MTFVYVPPGTFMMGSPTDEPGRDADETQHRVTLTRGYYIQTTELSQGHWKAVTGENPSHFQKCGDDCPVENVSWNDVQTFIARLNQMERTDKYRLPTEAEWEYACRAGTDTPYFFGQAPPRDEGDHDSEHPAPDFAKGRYRRGMLPEVAFLPNAWGLYHMHTDVWEWCHDWIGKYPSGPVVDPIGPPSGIVRVVRGGRMFIHDPLCRSADRAGFPPDYKSRTNGFRLARTP
jgi:formylglycine-generating enzyme required for sulfatase activity